MCTHGAKMVDSFISTPNYSLIGFIQGVFVLLLQKRNDNKATTRIGNNGNGYISMTIFPYCLEYPAFR